MASSRKSTPRIEDLIEACPARTRVALRRLRQHVQAVAAGSITREDFSRAALASEKWRDETLARIQSLERLVATIPQTQAELSALQRSNAALAQEVAALRAGIKRTKRLARAVGALLENEGDDDGST